MSGEVQMKLLQRCTIFFIKTDFPPNCRLLRLLCDACGGQNENSYLMVAQLCSCSTCKYCFSLSSSRSLIPIGRSSIRMNWENFQEIENFKKRLLWIFFRSWWSSNFGHQLDIVQHEFESFKKVTGMSQAKRMYIEKSDGSIKVRPEISIDPFWSSQKPYQKR